MSPTTDLNKLLVADLRKELTKRGLDSKGTKAQLVQRLKKVLKQEQIAAEEESGDDSSINDKSNADSSTLDTSRDEPIDKETALNSKQVSPNKGKQTVPAAESNTRKTIDSLSSNKGKTENHEEEQCVSSEGIQQVAVATTPTNEVEEPKVEEQKAQEESVGGELETTNGENSEPPPPLRKNRWGTKAEKKEIIQVEEKSKMEELEKEERGSEQVATELVCGEEVKEKESGSGNEQASVVGGKGEKRKHSSSSPTPASRSQRKRSRSPVKENEPEVDPEKVLLSWYDSDLHLQIDKDSLLSAKPLYEGVFGYLWAGARANRGVSSGKVRFEVKLTEACKWEDYVTANYNRRDNRNKQLNKEESKNNLPNKSTMIGANVEAGEEEEGETVKEKEDNAIEMKDAQQPDSTSTSNQIEQAEGQEGEAGRGVEGKEGETMQEQSSELEKMETDQVQESIQINPQENNVTESNESENKTKSTDMEEEENQQQQEQRDEEPKIISHFLRVGWSLSTCSLQLGEDSHSYGYDSNGFFVTNSNFQSYGNNFKVGDVVGSYLNITDEAIEIRYTLNGNLQSDGAAAVSIPLSELPSENFALFPHILSRNISFEVNFGSLEQPWFANPDSLSDYVFIENAKESTILGPNKPEKRSDCEVLLMCGLPGCGKTQWVTEHLQKNTDKKYTVIGNSQLLERMTVQGKPLKESFKGRWSVLLDKLQRCLNKLTEIAPQRRRNYIIDQTNVFPSAQRRKLRPFEGFKRCAVVVIVDEEEQAKRQAAQEAQSGKDDPDSALWEKKGILF